MKKIIAIVALASAGILSACGSDRSQFDDASVGVVSDSPQFVMTNLDGYPNIAVRCFGPHLILTTTRGYGDAVNVNWDDPLCEGGVLADWVASEFTGEFVPEGGEDDE